MAADTVLVSLLEISLNADAPERRRAAKYLLEALRSGSTPADIAARLAAAETSGRLTYANDVRLLARSLGIALL